MATRRTREFLDGNGVRYLLVSHSRAYTAQEVAEAAHVRGKFMAKSVVVQIDGRLAIAVVPATKDLDLDLLRRHVGAHEVRLAEEHEFIGRFAGCQVGTAPPFGNLFGMETYVDQEMAKQEFIAFNAGTHTDIVLMHFDQYRRLARPFVLPLATDPLGVRFHVVQI